ncbi:hypothetical protein BCR33DRAFT_721825 [Rhizoclosmatium globosum]|uniref:Uncharacterized protein n=1 Tax=Rhizoclosmatium globosum TaxID=329046 RepID=A0A1Y2BQ92_9FUNG|nr:hypothetical protein BCR33DRAFT_721825 [Rhizoclosmatium globosum]|eukprot:ORY36908.1 hypothetical protein BCR33DRAFT_721825 [Rhizoclosmatium globosum]
MFGRSYQEVGRSRLELLYCNYGSGLWDYLLSYGRFGTLSSNCGPTIIPQSNMNLNSTLMDDYL